MLTTQQRLRLMPDPALPSRDLLLDPGAVSDRLSGLLGRNGQLGVDKCVLIRAKYRIGESLRVVYRLEIAGRTFVVAGRAFPAGTPAATSAVRRAAPDLIPVGELRAVTHDPLLDTVWWTFPNDRRLRGLDALLRPTFDLAAPLVGVPRWTSSEVVEYAPERSVTLRAIGRDGAVSAYVKAYAPGTTDLRSLARRYAMVERALGHSATDVSSPKPLWWSDTHSALLMEAMPGRQWDQLEVASVAPALRSLGAAIATLHDAPFEADTTSIPALPQPFSRFRRLDMTRIRHTAELIGVARPDVADASRRLADALATRQPSPARRVLLHGDCHPKNALVQGDHVALIDLDQAGIGPAAADVGSFLARLIQARLVDGDGIDGITRDGSDIDRSDSDDLAGAFLDGYSTVRPLPDAVSLAWHTAAAVLVERSMRAVNRVHPEVLAQLDSLLAAGLTTLCGGRRP